MSNQSEHIPVVSIGVSRSVGFRLIGSMLKDTPFRVTAFLDQKEMPEAYRYSPHNLGVVLNALNPLPRALVVGNAMDPKYLEEVEKVWNEFVDFARKKEQADGVDEVRRVFVALPMVQPPSDGPPTPGQFLQGPKEELTRQLDETFGTKDLKRI